MATPDYESLDWNLDAAADSSLATCSRVASDADEKVAESVSEDECRALNNALIISAFYCGAHATQTKLKEIGMATSVWNLDSQGHLYCETIEPFSEAIGNKIEKEAKLASAKFKHLLENASPAARSLFTEPPRKPLSKDSEGTPTSTTPLPSGSVSSSESASSSSSCSAVGADAANTVEQFWSPPISLKIMTSDKLSGDFRSCAYKSTYGVSD